MGVVEVVVVVVVVKAVMMTIVMKIAMKMTMKRVMERGVCSLPVRIPAACAHTPPQINYVKHNIKMPWRLKHAWSHSLD